MMLDKPQNTALIRQELLDMTGREISVSFTDHPRSADVPDTKKLDELRKFPIVKFD